MSITSQFDIPLLASSQAQKEVTVNEALTRIDHALNLSVKDRDLAMPPANPEEGDAYLVAASAADDWANYGGEIAYFNQLWRFISPKPGMLLWVEDEASYLQYDGSTWVSFSADGSESTMIRPKKLVIIGDSVSANGASGSSFGEVLNQRGLVSWLQIHLGFPFTFNVHYDGIEQQGQDVSIGGDTVANMRTRFGNDVLAQNPDIVLIQGGTNDVFAGTSSAAIIADIKAMVDAALAHGVLVAVMPILPRSDANSRIHGASSKDWIGNQQAVHHAVNRWIRDYAHSMPNVILIDPYAYLLDGMSSNGDVADSMTYDGLHPSPKGAFALGKVAAEALANLTSSTSHVVVSPTDEYDATDHPYGNLHGNGTMLGTGGSVGAGVSGVVPNLYALERNGGSHITAVGAKVSRSDGLPGEQFQMICSVDGTGSTIGRLRLRNSSPSTFVNVVAGGWYEASCEVEVFASANSTTPLNGLYLELNDISTGGRYTRCLNPAYSYSGADYPLPDVAWKGVLKTPALQLEGVSGMRVYLYIQMDEAKNDSVEIRVSNLSVRQLENAPDLGV